MGQGRVKADGGAGQVNKGGTRKQRGPGKQALGQRGTATSGRAEEFKGGPAGLCG